VHRIKTGPNKRLVETLAKGRWSLTTQVEKDVTFMGLNRRNWPETNCITQWVRKQANARESTLWRMRMTHKQTLAQYRICQSISEKSELYGKTKGSSWLFAFRTGSAPTRARTAVWMKKGDNRKKLSELVGLWFGNREACPSCITCGLETQDHILGECSAYSKEREVWFQKMANIMTRTFETQESVGIGLLLVNVGKYRIGKISSECTKQFLSKVMSVRTA